MCLLVAKMCVQVMFSIILGTDQSNGVEIPEAIECIWKNLSQKKKKKKRKKNLSIWY
jgi:Flp pilus assembly protein TadB